MIKSSLHIRRITISAMFLAIALILRITFSFDILLSGQQGMRIGISGIFSAMPAILFGPFYGAAVSGLTDLMGHFLKPQGAFLPWMTVVAILGGFTRGLIWNTLRGKITGNEKTAYKGTKTRVAVLIITILLLFTGIANTFALRADGINKEFYAPYIVTITSDSGVTKRYVDSNAEIDTSGLSAVSRMIVTNTISKSDPDNNMVKDIIFMTAGVTGCGVFGLLLLLAEWIISKKVPDLRIRILPLLLAMLISAILVTTLNTFVLIEVYASWKLLPLSVLLIPRIIESVLSNTIYVYFIATLLAVFEKQRSLRELINHN